MNAFDPALVTRLGLTLLHFLWQGTALALLLALALWVLKARSPRLRYAIACLAMLGLLAAPLLTWGRLGEAPRPLASAARAALSAKAASTPAAAITPANRSASLNEVLPQAVGLWALGVSLLSLRLAGGWAWLQWLRRRPRTVPARDDLQLRLLRLCQRMNLASNLRLLLCERVPGPTVLGWLRPVILIPPAALTGLTPDQLELVLAHEVAHVLRHDFAVNLLQSCVEVLLFYHPAVWWVSAKIRQERELCCDDLAVHVTGDALDYAAALTQLEALSLRVPHPPRAADRLALAATGGSFMHRIQRLVSPTSPTPLAPRAGLVLLLLLGGGYTLQARARVVAPAQATPPSKYTGAKMTVDLERVDLVQFVRLAADTAQLNLIVDPGVRGISNFKFTDTPWDQILDETLKPMGFAWERRNGMLFIAPGEKLLKMKRLTASLFETGTPGEAFSGRKISLDIQKMELASVLNLLAKEGEIAITVDQNVQGSYNFKFTDTPWDQVLDLVLLNCGLDWELRNGTLHVFRPQALPRP